MFYCTIKLKPKDIIFSTKKRTTHCWISKSEEVAVRFFWVKSVLLYYIHPHLTSDLIICKTLVGPTSLIFNTWLLLLIFPSSIRKKCRKEGQVSVCPLIDSFSKPNTKNTKSVWFNHTPKYKQVRVFNTSCHTCSTNKTLS